MSNLMLTFLENRKTNACNDKRIKIWYTNAQC